MMEEDSTSLKGISVKSNIEVATFNETDKRITYIKDTPAPGLVFDTGTKLDKKITFSGDGQETRPKSMRLLFCVKI